MKVKFKDGMVFVPPKACMKIRKYAERVLEDLADEDLGPMLMWADTLGEFVNNLEREEIPEPECTMDWANWAKGLSEQDMAGLRAFLTHRPDFITPGKPDPTPRKDELGDLNGVTFSKSVLRLNTKKSCGLEDAQIEICHSRLTTPVCIRGVISQRKRIAKKYVRKSVPIKKLLINVLTDVPNGYEVTQAFSATKGYYTITPEFALVEQPSKCHRYHISLYLEDLTVSKK